MNKEKPEALWPAVCKHSFLRLMSCYSCRLYIGGQNCIYNHNRFIQKLTRGYIKISLVNYQSVLNNIPLQ